MIAQMQQFAKEAQLAEDFGRVAAHDGLTLADCKYTAGTIHAVMWRIGFKKQSRGE